MSQLIKDHVLRSNDVDLADGVEPRSRGRFSIIVPVLNASNHLKPCLDSILAAMDRYANTELILIDNGSTDGSYEVLLNHYSTRARVEQIRGKTVAALRNQGAAWADGEFLSFVDSDCVLDPDYFEQALNSLRVSGADATGARVDLRDSASWVEETWHEIHVRKRDGVVNYINSGNFVIRKYAFSAVGGFDEQLIGTEDVELCLRLNQGGFKIFEARALRAVHLGADRTLGVLFRKTAWRSLGMFGVLRSTWKTLPFFTTIAYLILCATAVINLIAGPGSLSSRVVLSTLLCNLAPAGTVIYRGLRAGRFYTPLRAVVLYHVYFAARVYGMCKLILSLDKSHPSTKSKK